MISYDNWLFFMEIHELQNNNEWLNTTLWSLFQSFKMAWEAPESPFLEPICAYPNGFEVFKVRNIHEWKNLDEFLKINVIYGACHICWYMPSPI